MKLIIKRIIAILMSVLAIISMFATSIVANASSPKPALSGISATYDKSIYNDKNLVITVNLSSVSLCDQIAITIGNVKKYIKPTTKTKPIRQTAKVTFSAYTFEPGKYTVSVTAKNSSGSTTKKIGTLTVSNTYAISNKVLTVKGVKMSEFKIGGKYTSSRYVTINGKKKDMAAWECYGWSRYLETKLYGTNSGIASSKFTKLSGSKNDNPSNAKLKTLIQTAGVGAHIRTASGHSLTVIGISNAGFTISDANADYNNTIRTKSYTWSSFRKASGKLSFIEIYKG